MNGSKPFHRKAKVLFKNELAGIIEETENGYRFTYNEEFSNNRIPISVSLPLRAEPFESKVLFSFFEGLLPEGWYMDLVSSKLKIDKNDHFGLLSATCQDTIGAVSIEAVI
jgi:serine/threonine-protein kinase HipA